LVFGEFDVHGRAIIHSQKSIVQRIAGTRAYARFASLWTRRYNSTEKEISGWNAVSTLSQLRPKPIKPWRPSSNSRIPAGWSPLLELVKMRASQINGCAYCLDMHSKDARALGETEQRLYALNGWRETPFYSECERAALEWTESITLISETRAPDDAYERVSKKFNAEELANLTLAIATINSWNRLSIAFRVVPEGYTSNWKPSKTDA
jgi:AhpD family alkylhydroperoxidase